MASKQELLQQADHDYDALKAAIEGLDEARMREVWLGHWGVREILAHITGWHHEMLPALARVARGEAPYPDGTYDDFDRWNAKFVDERKDRATDAIVSEMDASHRALLTAAAGLPEERFAEGQPAAGLIDGISAAHYREHAEQIRTWRKA